MELVAQRAGVTRPTLYRRYANKQALVVGALTRTFATVNPQVPDTGEVTRDVQVLLDNIARMLRTTATGDVMRALVQELARDSTLADFAGRFADERRVLLRTALQRGIDRRQLPPAFDVEIAIDALLGALYFRFLLLGAKFPRGFLARLVTQVLR